MTVVEYRGQRSGGMHLEIVVVLGYMSIHLIGEIAVLTSALTGIEVVALTVVVIAKGVSLYRSRCKGLEIV